MPTYTSVPNAAVFAGGRPRGTVITALRDNPEAMFAGDPTAVAAGKTLADLAHPRFAVGAVELINFTGLNVAKPGASFTNSSASSASGTVYESILSFVAMNAGTVRLSVDLRTVTNALTSILRVQKNGIVLGSVSDINTTFNNYTFDFTFVSGDLIGFESGMSYSLSSGASGSVEFRNLKLLANKRGVFRI